MKLETLLTQLERTRELSEADQWDSEMVMLIIIDRLVAYIGNPKVEEKINEIPF